MTSLIQQNDDEVELAALLHLAHPRAEELGLLGLLGLGLHQLGLLLDDELVIERNLRLNDLDLLLGQVGLLVQRGLLLENAGLLAAQGVDLRLLIGLLGAKLILLALQGVDLRLAHRGRPGGENDREQAEHKDQRQNNTNDSDCGRAFHLLKPPPWKFR